MFEKVGFNYQYTGESLVIVYQSTLALMFLSWYTL